MRQRLEHVHLTLRQLNGGGGQAWIQGPETGSPSTCLLTCFRSETCPCDKSKVRMQVHGHATSHRCFLHVSQELDTANLVTQSSSQFQHWIMATALQVTWILAELGKQHKLRLDLGTPSRDLGLFSLHSHQTQALRKNLCLHS